MTTEKKKSTGLLLLIIPPALFFVSLPPFLFFWFLKSFSTTITYIEIFLWDLFRLLPVVFAVLSIVCIPIGLVLLVKAKKEKKLNSLSKNNSKKSEVIDYTVSNNK